MILKQYNWAVIKVFDEYIDIVKVIKKDDHFINQESVSQVIGRMTSDSQFWYSKYLTFFENFRDAAEFLIKKSPRPKNVIINMLKIQFSEEVIELEEHLNEF